MKMLPDLLFGFLLHETTVPYYAHNNNNNTYTSINHMEAKMIYVIE